MDDRTEETLQAIQAEADKIRESLGAVAVVILVATANPDDEEDDSDTIYSARSGSSIAGRGLVLYAAEKYQESARYAMRKDLEG